MAVLYNITIKGDPDEIISKVEGITDEAWEIIKGKGFIGETLGRTEDGVIIAEVWESHDGFQEGMGHPVVQRDFAAVGMPTPSVDGPYAVIRDFHPGRVTS